MQMIHQVRLSIPVAHRPALQLYAPGENRGQKDVQIFRQKQDHSVGPVSYTHLVSIKMAKEQNLSLNPSKISGVCGRLMCLSLIHI